MKLLALMKKEFHRFFHDPRLILTMILPGILIFVLYWLMGDIVYAEPEKYDLKVYLQGGEGAPVATMLIETACTEAEYTLEWLPLEAEGAARDAVTKGEAAAILTFSENFDYTSAMGEGGEVHIIYDPMEDAGTAFYGLAAGVLQSYGMRFQIIPESLASETDIAKDVLQSLLPFIIVCFIFSACMSVTLESVAGEKERGTLATILVTSAKRRDIALGKVLPLSCISMLGALSSFLGVVLSMPRLMGLSVNVLGGYSVGSYLLFFLLTLSIVPCIVALISTVSTLARSVKEASGYTSVIMVLVMVVSIVTGFLPSADWVCAVPIFGAVCAMQRVFAGEIFVWQSFLAVGVNLALTALLVFVMTKLLSSERIMFGK